MNQTRKAKVIRIVDGTIYHLKDSENGNILIAELQPAPSKSGYHHLLKMLSETEVDYEMVKKSNKIKQQPQKSIIYLNDKELSRLYEQPGKIAQCTEEKVYEKDQIIECFIMQVECLRIKLYLFNENKFIIFYFSQLKLPKIHYMHPKQVWQKAEQYFRVELDGQFVQIKINGSEYYHEEINIFGEILKLHNGFDMKEKILEDGYADLSKNCEKYLNGYQIKKYTEIINESKRNNKGLWKQEIKITKGTKQIAEQKYNRWEEWNKNKTKFNEIKNVQQELKQIGLQLKNISIKTDINKCRILLETFLSVCQDCINEKNIRIVQEFVKIVINSLINVQTQISYNTDNYDFLRYLNKLILLIQFYVEQNDKLSNKNKEISVQIQKIIKIIFRCCFIGNETFHSKVFDKQKQFDFERFQFDPTSFSGISSYSEYSQSEEGQICTRERKNIKKISAVQTKIRINSTLLISNIFKCFESIVENYWEICIKSNILTKDFLQYLQTLKIGIQPTKITPEIKKHIVGLMRTNFGDYSLVLLIFFQHNAKVKINALTCIINMINNFQSRKIINTTQTGYVEKLLNKTKSSFIPKSFIVFSGLRNALYFMLFSLHHEKNVLIIINTFKALTELCQQSTLIDKMGFMEGMGLLMANYISPVLQFPWQVKELLELKCLCIDFLAALVNSQKKWQQMQNQYLMSQADKNINMCLIRIMTGQKNMTKQQSEKLLIKISKYFKNMIKRYYPSIFYEIVEGVSVWSTMTNYYIKYPNINLTLFLQEIYKCHFDQLSLMNNQNGKSTLSRKYVEIVSKNQVVLGNFLEEFIPVYSEITTNQNYISLINILTYISYNKWSQISYTVAKQFLIHCFESINGQPSNKNYANINQLKNNSLVRLALIKLLGYISFCKQFQTAEYSTRAIRNLLDYSRKYKSPNTVTKITWGISNWSNIDCFKEGLSQSEIKECLDYMIKFSQSEKQKIASNCTRGIGFFLTKLRRDGDLEQCRAAIIMNLLHPITKVRTNSTKTLRMMIANNLLWKPQQMNNIKIQQLIGTLEQNILKNSYHLQMQTLLLIKDLGNPLKQNQVIKIYTHILHDLLSHTAIEYEFSQMTVYKQLRKVVLQEMVKHPKHIIGNEHTSKDFIQIVQNFILDSQEESLRKETQHSKILQRGFEKGQEALNAIFNIKNQQYEQEQMIRTKFTMGGVQYEANQEDIQLLYQIKSVGKQLGELDVQEDKWKFLSEMSIQGNKIVIGNMSNVQGVYNRDERKIE